FALQHVVARLDVADEALGPGRDPLDRAAETPGRPRHRDVLWIDLDLRAEAAADVTGPAADLFGRDAEDPCEIRRVLMHALKAGVQRVARRLRVPPGQRRAALPAARVRARR